MVARSTLLRAAAVAALVVVLGWAIPIGCGRLWGNRAVVVYGRVIDQDGNAVPEPDVSASVTRQRWFMLPGLWYDGNAPTIKEFTITGDAKGRFSLSGGEGIDAVLSGHKSGYFGSFRAAVGFSSASALPNLAHGPDHPLIFHLWRTTRPEPLLRGKLAVDLKRDGTPASVDLVTGTILSSDEGGDVVFSVKSPRTVSYYDKTAWWCELKVHGGGMIETCELYPFVAPSTGYQPVRRYDFGPANPPGAYAVELERVYFLEARSGRLHGRIKMTLKPSMSPDAEAQLEYAVNIEGSRNLEPGAETDIGPVQPKRARSSAKQSQPARSDGTR